MYRALIVEDDELMQSQLQKFLQEEMPGSEFIAVKSVEEARAELEDARETKLPFDAAILDIKLPKNAGDSSAEPDTSLRDVIWSLPWRTLIFRISSSPEEIKKDKRAAESSQMKDSLSRIYFASKTESDFTRRILRELKRDRIRRQMEAAFVGPVTDYVNYVLHDLMRDIKLFWQDLDENDKKEILARFELKVEGNEVEVKLAARRGKPKTSAKQDPS